MDQVDVGPAVVTEGEPSSSNQAEALAPEVDSPSTENSESEGQREPQNKAANRFQKLANSLKSERASNQKLSEQLKSLEQARMLHERLSSDPRKSQLVQALLGDQADDILGRVYGRHEAEKKVDPYEQFAPEVAEKFRQMDALEKWREERETESKTYREQQVQQNVTTLEEAFGRKLTERGVVGKDGIFNDMEVNLISKATLAALAETTKNPYLATEKQLDAALDSAFKGLEAWSKRSLKQVVRSTNHVPVSGSSSGGVPPGQKVDYSNEDNRVARLLSALKS